MRKEAETLDNPRGFRFDIRQTNIAKGVALLMLLWHHLFYNGADYYQRFTTVRLYHGVPIECTVSDYCKVCVAVFLLLSGYGLYMSWQSYENKMIRKNGKFTIVHQLLFVKNHLLKLMFGFWFVYILFVPLSSFIGTPFWQVYKGNFWYGLIDFFGLANLCRTPSMNGTWWFMSVIILLYLLFPLMMFVLKRSPETLVALAIFITFSPAIRFLPKLPLISRYYTWLIPFTLGMYFARYLLFEKIGAHNSSVVKAIIMCLALLAACIAMRLYLHHKVYFDGFFAVPVILTAYLLLSRVPVLSKVLEQLGIQSGAIFMFHTFIFSRYFKDFIYSFKYAVFIYIILTVICYLVAVGLQYLKKLIRYDKLVKKLTT